MPQPRPQVMPPLVECLQDYCAWLRTTSPPVDPWERVLLVEHRRLDLVPVTPEEFLERWHEIVSTVDRNWVNFDFVGCRAGVLVVSVVWIPPPKGEEGWPVHPIWVNWSGASELRRAGVCCRGVFVPWAGTRGPDSYEMFCPYCSNENPAVGEHGVVATGLRIPFSTHVEAEQAVHDHLTVYHPYWAE